MTTTSKSVAATLLGTMGRLIGQGAMVLALWVPLTAAAQVFSSGNYTPVAIGSNTLPFIYGPAVCTLTATGPGGTTTTTYVQVGECPAAAPWNGVSCSAAAPTVNVNILPATGTAGAALPPATVTWNTLNATGLSYSCAGASTASGPLAPVAGGAGVMSYPFGLATCTFTATGPGGSTSAVATIEGSCPAATVWDGTNCSAAPPPPPPPPPPLPSLNISMTAATTIPGQPYTLSWTSANATSGMYECVSPTGAITNGVLGSVAAGSIVGTQRPGTTTCMVEVTGPGGTVSQSASLAAACPLGTVSDGVNCIPVGPPPPPPSFGLTSILTALYQPNSNFRFTWMTFNATNLSYSCTGAAVYAGVLAPVGMGSYTVGPLGFGSMDCTLTATGPGGSASVVHSIVTDCGAGVWNGSACVAGPPMCPGDLVDYGLGCECPAGSLPADWYGGSPDRCIPPTGTAGFCTGNNLSPPPNAIAKCDCQAGVDIPNRLMWEISSGVGVGERRDVYFLPNWPSTAGAVFQPAWSIPTGPLYATCF